MMTVYKLLHPGPGMEYFSLINRYHKMVQCPILVAGKRSFMIKAMNEDHGQWRKKYVLYYRILYSEFQTEKQC